MPRFLVAAFAVCLALPVTAQTAASQQSPDAPVPAAAAEVDTDLVGRWLLAEVESAGSMETFAVDVKQMACQFGADGEASIGMTFEQDADTYTRERLFRFVTDEGQILSDGAGAAQYELLDSGELRLTMDTGLIVRLRRADA